MDVEATRKALGLSRKQLAAKAGVTESAVWSVEHGKDPRGGEAVRQAVLQALDPNAVTTVEAEAAPSTGAKPTYSSRGGKKIVPATPRPDWTYNQEWMGLRPGDHCKVSGEPLVATFKEHVVTDAGKTWVTVILAGKWRSFDPDRVQPAAMKKRRGPGDGLNGKTDWMLEVRAVSGEVHTLLFATYKDAREQAIKYEVPNGGQARVKNYLGTIVEEWGWDSVVV